MSDQKRQILLIICLCVAVAAPFLPALRAEFTSWDDNANVTENPYLPKGLREGLFRLLSQRYENLYIPMTYATYWVEFRFWGARPFGYHLVNLLIHMTSAAFVFLIFRRLLSKRLPALAAALWWGVHPLNVEPVAWVTGLKDVLSASLMFLSLYLYMLWRERGSEGGERAKPAWIWSVSVMAFALACLSKPSAVGFPLVLLAYDLFVTRHKWKALWAPAPYFAISLLTVLVTLFAQKVEDWGIPTPTLYGRFKVAGDSCMFYLEKMVWPSKLCAIYGRTVEVVTSSSWPWTGLAAACLIGGVALFMRDKWRLGVAMFVAGLAPVSGLIPFVYQGQSTVADRYVYFAGVGIALVLGDAAARLSTHVSQRFHRLEFLGSAGLVLWAFFLGAVSWNQSGVWRNSLTLWQRVIDIKPDVAMAWHKRGAIWDERGDYKQAIADYSQAIELRRDFVDAYNNRGTALINAGLYDLAIEDYSMAIAFRQDYAVAYNNRGIAWDKKSEWDRAIADFTSAIQFKQDYAEAYNNRGNVWGKKGHYQQTLSDCSEAIRLSPDCAEAYNNRAVANYGAKKYDDAWKDIRRCRELGGSVNPHMVEALSKDSGRTE